jgi:hypothetical protein
VQGVPLVPNPKLIPLFSLNCPDPQERRVSARLIGAEDKTILRFFSLLAACWYVVVSRTP